MTSLGDIFQFDYTLKGKRTKLIHTNDPITKLQPGTTGTIKYTFDSLGIRCISVDWHTFPKSSMMLLEGIDQYEILED